MTERGGDFFRKKQRGEEWGWREREDEEIRDDTLSHTRTEREGEREGDSERDCTGTGGWGWGGLLWDARTQWHDTDALSYCAESSGWGGGGYWAREEGRKKKRRWVPVRAQCHCTVSTRRWGEDDGRYRIEMKTITTRKKGRSTK